MKKLMIFMFCMIFLIGITSALEWDNALTYSNSDIKVELKNWFGLGTNYGSAELKSHSNINEIKEVPIGNSVVMFYDFNFSNTYNSGLGDVKFIDVKSGQEVNRNWEFVYLQQVQEIKDIYGKTNCQIIKENSTQFETCDSIKTGEEIIVKDIWKPYTTRDIPNTLIRIGIKVEVREGDLIDGVWNIGGKDVNKHAQWTEELNVGLVTYYNFDESSGTILTDVKGYNLNGTLTGKGESGTHWYPSGGIINGALWFNSTSFNWVNMPSFGDIPNGTMSFWVNSYGVGSNRVFMSKYTDGAPANNDWELGHNNNNPPTVTGTITNSSGTSGCSVSELTLFNGTWAHLVYTWNENDGIQMFINGTLKDSASCIGGKPVAETWGIGARVDESTNPTQRQYEGFLDELGIWNRTLSSSEVSQLYNGEIGISYINLYTIRNPYPDNNSVVSNTNLNVSALINTTIPLTNVSIFVNGNLNQTNTSTITNSIYTFDLALTTGSYDILWEAYTSVERIILANRFEVDTINPSLNITAPHNLVNYHKTGDNITLRWNISDSNLGVCRYDFNGTNQTVTCGDNTTVIQNVNNISNTALTFYSNDTIGNTNNTVVTWNYSVWENDRGSNNATTEGATELFYVDFTIQTGSLSTVKLWYDGNDTDSTFSVISGRNYNATLSNFPVVTVDANKVVDLFWQIDFGTVQANTSTSTQHINNFDIDTCSSNTNVLYNFTIVDEDSQAFITPSGATDIKAEVDLEIRNYATTTAIELFNASYNATNPFAVCLSTDLGGVKYNIDTQVQYEGQNKFREFFHIQNDTLDSDDITTNTTLYALSNSTGQVFKITFKDDTFLPVPSALVNIQREYVGEGVSKIVEIPKTDSDGETVAHLVVDEVLYTFIVIKNGETLGTFVDKLVHCPNPSLSECVIPLNAFSSGLGVDDFTTIEGFSFTLTFDEDTREITSVFTSDETASIKLNATLIDGLGSTEVCSQTLSSTSGTLSCIVPTAFGNGTVIAKVSKNNVLQGQGTISLQQSSKDLFGDSQVFIALFIMLSLVGLSISNNPIITAIMLIIGAILNILLNVTESSGFIGGSATILWLLVAIIIILIKATRRT